MKKKIVILISLIFVLFTAIILGANLEFASKIGNSNYAEIKLNNPKCEYSINEETKTIQIQEYQGNEENIVIPSEIDGYAVESVSAESFSSCYNLETIKIPESIAKEINEIPDFEKNNDVDQDGYVTFTTTREYSEVYEEYLTLSAKEKEELPIIPNKFEIPMEKIYSSEMKELYGSAIENIESTDSSYDLRNDISIKVEDQKEYGNCYAYASLSSVETNMALTRGEVADFSEVHAGVMTTGFGGYLLRDIDSYYANKIGLVYETDFPMEKIYDNKTNENYKLIDTYLKGQKITGINLSNEEIEKIQNFAKDKKAVEFVTKTIAFPSITLEKKLDGKYNDEILATRAVIKEHIKKYGSIAASVAMSGTTKFGENVVLNNKESKIFDHGVSIVGWDDNFAATNFAPDSRPTNNGAYLVLNSWGEDWGQEGYFWVSYEDAFIESNLVGVVSVEDTAENMNMSAMTITDLNANKIMATEGMGITTNITDADTTQTISNHISIGKRVEIVTDVTVENGIDGENVSISFRNGEEDLTEGLISSGKMTITGTELLNNVANVTIILDTTNFKSGDYIIEASYAGESITKTIEIVGEYKYNVKEDGTISLTKYYGTATEVVVPNAYEGYQVTSIGERAFQGKNVTKVTVSEGILSIGNDAFSSCTNLVTVELPNGLLSIGQLAFYNCISLGSNQTNASHTFKIPNTVTTIGEYAFQQCSKLRYISLPESLTTIERGLFYQCTLLRNLVIPNKVTSIGKGAFQQCLNLTFMKIPRSVTTLSEDIYMNSTYFATMVVFDDTTTILGKDMFYGCNKVTVYGQKGSAAENFATNANYTFIELQEYNVTYEGNAGDVNIKDFPENTIKIQADDFIISEKIPYRFGYIFKGWATNALATTPKYQPGDIIPGSQTLEDMNKESDITLYALWEDDPNVDRIDVGAFDLKDTTYIYDGNEKTILSEGHNPEIVDVSYKIEPIGETTLKNGKAIEVGQYKRTATYSLLNGDSYMFTGGINTKVATLTIEKATYDMSAVRFNNAEYTYDRTTKNLVVTGNVPEGIVISYENNYKKDVGEYTVTANFKIPDEKNYNKIDPMTAILIIKKANVDMSKVSFVDKVVTYNGKEQSIEISGNLPQVVTVSYSNNTGIQIGTYTATAIFTLIDSEKNNYYPVPNMTATLTIEKGSLDLGGVLFQDKTYEYDGTEKVLEITGELPEGVSVSYSNNRLTNVGKTTAIAHFTIDESEADKYDPIEDFTAILEIIPGTIDMKGVSFNNAEFVYDGKSHSITIEGNLPPLVSVSYENNERTEIGTNVAKAHFIIEESQRTNYNPISSLTANLTITKIPTTITITNKNDLGKQYDGEQVIEPTYTISREGSVQDNIQDEVVFEYYKGTSVSGEKLTYVPVDSGTYTVKVTLKEDEYFAESYDIATFTITKIPSTIKITNIDDLNRTYNGEIVEATYQGSRNGNVTIQYINTTTNDITVIAPKDAGTYKVKVTLAEELNYSGATAEATFTISKADVDMSGVSFKNVKIPYDGKYHTLEITGELPEGVEVTYTNNTARDVGIYNAKASFKVIDVLERNNYKAIPDMTAILEIAPSSGKIEIKNKDAFGKQYDGLPVVEPIYEPSREGNIRVEFYAGTKAEGEILAERPVNAGKYTLKVVLEAFEGYLEVSDQVTFEITKVPSTIEITNLEELNRTYNGEEVKAICKSSREGDITIEYTNVITGEKSSVAPINAGNYKVTATLAEESNHAGAVVEENFEIRKVETSISITNEENLTRTYNGKSVEVSYNSSRQGQIIVEYTNNDTKETTTEAPINAGNYKVTVSLVEEENYAGATAEATFEIRKIESSITITNGETLNKVYDGSKTKEIEYIVNREVLDGENIQNRVYVEYINRTNGETSEEPPKESGLYTVKVSLEAEANYAGSTTEYDFEIEKATMNMSQVKFNNVTYNYDEKEKEIFITGTLPDDVEVSYENNKATEPGRYVAVAKFTITDEVKLRNYKPIPDMTAILEIVAVTGSIEITNKDKLTKQYDGLPVVEPEYDKSREGNVRIEYYAGTQIKPEALVERPVDSGTYVVKVILEAYQGYLETFDTAEFRITKVPGTIKITNKEDLNRTYNGEALEAIVDASREGDITIEYYVGPNTSGEKLESAPINAGTYTVKATLAEELNYAGATDQTTFKIDKIISTLKITNSNELNRIYDGNAIEVAYEASREGNISTKYTNLDTNEETENAPSNIGRYNVSVVLAEETNYTGATASINFEITKIPTTIKITNKELLNRTYNGEVVEVEFDKSREGDISIEYIDTISNEILLQAPKDVGSYSVKVSIAETEIYKGAEDTYSYNINKATKDMSKVNFKNAKFDYDQTEKEILITGELPEGVEVSYENNKGTNVGKYNARAHFTIVPEEEVKNFNEIPDMTAVLEIVAVTGKIEITNKEAFDKVYDGNPVVEPTIKQSRPGNVRIEYYSGRNITGEKLEGRPVKSGIYTVKAVLEAYEGYLETFDTATFEISKIPSTIEITNLEALNRTYNGEAVSATYKASREGNITVEYENLATGEKTAEPPVNSGNYKVIATLAEEENQAGAIAEENFEIRKIESNITITNEELLNRTYNGEAVEVTYNSSREGTIVVEYINTATNEKTVEAPKNTGNYKVIVTLAEEENYAGATAQVSFEIRKIESSITITNGEALNKVYDGEKTQEVEYVVNREVLAGENIQNTISVEYINRVTSETSKNTPIESGIYKVKITLAEELNYAGATAEYDFEISKATMDMSSVKFDSVKYNYDETEKEILITGTLPEDVEVSYENNKATEPGKYEAVAKFTITDEVKNRNYNPIPDMKATLEIVPVAGKIEIKNKDEFSKQYDGLPVVEPIYEASREGNGRVEFYKGTEANGEIFSQRPVDAGTYTVKVVLEAYASYLEASDQKTFTITKVPGTIEIKNKDALNRTYNGEKLEAIVEPSREGTIIVE